MGRYTEDTYKQLEVVPGLLPEDGARGPFREETRGLVVGVSMNIRT